MQEESWVRREILGAVSGFASHQAFDVIVDLVIEHRPNLCRGLSGYLVQRQKGSGTELKLAGVDDRDCRQPDVVPRCRRRRDGSQVFDRIAQTIGRKVDRSLTIDGECRIGMLRHVHLSC